VKRRKMRGKANERDDVQQKTGGTGVGVDSTEFDEDASACERKNGSREAEGGRRGTEGRRSARRRPRQLAVGLERNEPGKGRTDEHQRTSANVDDRRAEEQNGAAVGNSRDEEKRI
jgi:hypothetical protein